jgi:glycosyltransferase involved in cell wall biosynthesis
MRVAAGTNPVLLSLCSSFWLCFATLHGGRDLSHRVNVLLATYNGVRYLCEQLQSIEAQTLPAAQITVRDDGSTDGSEVLVQGWAEGRSNVRQLQGPRLGAANSFLALLDGCGDECDYFAFADQDDVWLPDKMERAVTRLSGVDGEEPAMYCSRAEYVGEDLEHIGYSRIPKRVDFANALVENIAIGCTVVLNRSARNLLRRGVPRKAIMHDWWCYLVVSAFGKVIFDEWPSFKYRQHSGNVLGGTSSRIQLLRQGIARFAKRSPRVLLSDQAIEFRRGYGDSLTQEKKRMLDRFLTVRGSLWARLCYNAAMDVRRQSWIDTATLRTMILMGRV